ncbi:MAG: hypothetical protein KAS15_06470 [Nanoarchaeota archaeon]|nr:hypothetical protein [Nanoarchaeota archaeon]
MYESNPDVIEMRNKIGGIKRDIETKKMELGIQDGHIVESIDDLVCPYHDKPEFNKILIRNSQKYSSKDGLHIFNCSKCADESPAKKGSEAYECHNCGIVKGEPFEKNFTKNSMDGIRYHCKVCDNAVGEYTW